jgi:hypothetical protein
MPPLPKGPTRELGTSQVNAPGVMGATAGLPGWAVWAAEGEHVPEWADRLTAAATVDRMLFDSQLWSLFMGLVLPLLSYTWWIEPNDADEPRAEALAADLGLPVGEPPAGEDGPVLPGLYRFNFLEHLWEALLAVAHGHYYFETLGEYDDADGLWHLRKLAPRPPASIMEIQVDPQDGGLKGIRQLGARYEQRSGTLLADMPPSIPVSALLAYTWLPDGRRRWTGRSMLRPVYREWLVKDRLLRVDAINHERAGGVPTIETDNTYQGASLEELRQLASEFRVGEDSGSALPPGARMVLARAGGTDVVGSMRYLDESMARAWQGMVRQLGQTVTGSRALGGTFADLEALLRQVIASWFSMTFREHLIEDWWAYNVAPMVPGRPVAHPLLRWRPPPLDAGSAVPNSGIAAPASQLPSDPGGNPVPGGAPAGAVPPVARSRRRGRAGDAEAAADPVGSSRGGDSAPGLERQASGILGPSHASVVAAASVPARPLRREPFPHEVRAAVDFASMDAAYETAAVTVAGVWERDWLPGMIADVVAAIRFTKTGTVRQRVTRTAMAALTVAPRGADVLADLLLTVARQAANGAADELLTQGVPVLAPSDDQLLPAVRDHADAVARQLADGVSLAASRRAVQASGGRSAQEVADDVAGYLAGLTHAWERDQLTGAVQQATNAGRFQVFDQVPADAPVRYHASELLDAATCDECLRVDGTEYATLPAAMRAYPSGGFLECKGGPRCRGTVVAVLPEDELDPAEVLRRPDLWLADG